VQAAPEPRFAKLGDAPVAYVFRRRPAAGYWPLELWYGGGAGGNGDNGGGGGNGRSGNGSPKYKGSRYRVVGNPISNTDVSRGFTRNFTIGYVRPSHGACYWGLPSISFDDPAFATPGGFTYWRGHAWGPLAMLTYWSLAHPAYENVQRCAVVMCIAAVTGNNAWAS
jgi:hypothetical protein